MKGKLIRLFLVDGKPNGLRTLEIKYDYSQYHLSKDTN